MSIYAEILADVLEGGRLEHTNDDGEINSVELEALVEFEAEERGADPQEAVAYALEHTDWYDPAA